MTVHCLLSPECFFFVCGLATLIAIESSYCKSYMGTVIYFRVISYVPLGIFAE